MTSSSKPLRDPQARPAPRAATAGVLGALALAALAAFANGTLRALGPRAAPVVQGAAVAAPPRGPDAFHPDRERDGAAPPAPRDGGTLRLLLEVEPEDLNPSRSASAHKSRVFALLHDQLIRRDWETWEFEPSVAASWRVFDRVALSAGGELVGAVAEEHDALLLTGEDGATRSLERAEVTRVDRGVVYVLQLDPRVTWHDGAPFDARDVRFSYDIARNPDVPSPWSRQAAEHLRALECPGPRVVRFEFAGPYFLAPELVAGLPLVPAHLFDLRDPRHPEHDPDATDQDLARAFNEHPLNRAWIGLGPYRFASWEGGVLELERFAGFHDPRRAGHFDRVRWTIVGDYQAQVQRLLAGEADFFARLSVEDYFGELTETESFKARYYKGWFRFPSLQFTIWNTRRPKLADARVRRALAHCLDFDAFDRGYYRGLAERVTAIHAPGSPDYDASIEPLAYDLERARALLLEAGWYDRDGDGWVDDGERRLEIEHLMIAGNPTPVAYASILQEGLAQVGVRLVPRPLEVSQLIARLRERAFDSIDLSWVVPPETDPGQSWHSAEVDADNYSGWVDEGADDLIEAIQVEVDPAKRHALYRQLHRLVHDAQPCLFGFTVPWRFAMSRRVRNLRTFDIAPGYRVSDWFFYD